MKNRRLDENWDYCFGRGLQDILEDKIGDPQAIAQAIKSKLKLLLNEWWMNTNDGFPLWQSILGHRNPKSVIDTVIIKRIKELKLPDGTDAILNISNVSSSYDSSDRSYSFSCYVDTVFGKLFLTNKDQ